MKRRLMKRVESDVPMAEDNVSEVDEAVVEEAEIPNVSEEEAVEGVAMEYPEQLNEDEKEALAKTAPEDENKGEVSTAKMNSVLNLISDEFNLVDKRYTMLNYKDSGSKVTMSLSNEDYDVTITVKDVYSKVQC